jgi:hypothetical protein
MYLPIRILSQACNKQMEAPELNQFGRHYEDLFKSYRLRMSVFTSLPRRICS